MVIKKIKQFNHFIKLSSQQHLVNMQLFTYVRRQDTQHNGTQYNDIQHNDIQHNDTQHNDTQHNDTQHNDTQHNDIQHNDSIKGVYVALSKMALSITTFCHYNAE
jgi:hypothetical protein